MGKSRGWDLDERDPGDVLEHPHQKTKQKTTTIKTPKQHVQHTHNLRAQPHTKKTAPIHSKLRRGGCREPPKRVDRSFLPLTMATMASSRSTTTWYSSDHRAGSELLVAERLWSPKIPPAPVSEMMKGLSG